MSLPPVTEVTPQKQTHLLSCLLWTSASPLSLRLPWAPPHHAYFTLLRLRGAPGRSERPWQSPTDRHVRLWSVASAWLLRPFCLPNLAARPPRPPRPFFSVSVRVSLFFVLPPFLLLISSYLCFKVNLPPWFSICFSVTLF